MEILAVLGPNRGAFASKAGQTRPPRQAGGDCIAVTLTNQMSDARTFGGFSKVNIHIHHVQFDTQASDGVITGLEYEMAVRPFAAEDDVLSSDARVHVLSQDAPPEARVP